MSDWEKVLDASLRLRWKSYRRALQRCQRKFSERAVHASRIQTRRLLSLIELLGVFLAETHLKKARRALKQHLDMFDGLRDTQVQLLLIDKQCRRFPETRSFRQALLEREKRSLKEVATDVREVKVRRVQKVLRSLLRQLKNLRKDSPHRARHRSAVLHAVQTAYERAAQLERAIDPGMAETIHRTRIAFKQFRYMVEALQPLYPEITRARVRAMQQYQSMMGDVQDTEVFLLRIDKTIRGDPQLAESLARLRGWLLGRRTAQIARCALHAARLHQFWPLKRGD